MKVQEIAITKIKPYEKNPRRNDAAVDAVAASIREFGWKQPIVVDPSTMEIIAGHTRYKAAKKLGLSVVPCVMADDLTAEQIKAYRLADNKTAELAEWDFNALEAELFELSEKFDMSDFGFDIEEISADGFGDEFSLPSGDKGELCQMTFTLHNEQAELITNKNGNALYEVVRQWEEQKKSL